MVTAFQLAIILFICLGSLTYGYCSSIIATTLGQPSFIAYFELDQRTNAESLIGAINGLFQAGGLLGAISVLSVPDRFGRRWALFVGGIFCLIGGALQAGSVNITMFLVARFLVGCGIGSLVTLTPLYQAEVSPTKIRGLLVGMHGVMLCAGYSVASWVGVGFYFLQHTTDQWRGPLAIQVLFPLLLCSGVFLVPESPRWLLLQNKTETALTEFKKIHANGSSEAAEQITQQEFQLLSAQVAHEMEDHVTLSEFWTRKSLRKRCIIGFLTFFAGQGTATLVINNYGPMLYSRLGFNPIQQLLIQSGWISVCPFANFVNSLIVDRIGRVRLLIFGLVGSITALIGECISVDIFERTGQPAAARVAVFFLFWHIALFGLSYDATSYVYASEIFPNPLRARGLGISMTGLFVSTLIFLQSAPTAFTVIGWKYYTVFITISTVMAVVFFFYFPETNGKSLEDVAEVFGDHSMLEDPTVEVFQKRINLSNYEINGVAQPVDGEKYVDTLETKKQTSHHKE